MLEFALALASKLVNFVAKWYKKCNFFTKSDVWEIIKAKNLHLKLFVTKCNYMANNPAIKKGANQIKWQIII